MRYAIFGALIVSLELFGVSFASAAMPANGSDVVKAGSSVVQVMQGCGKHYHRDRATKQCVPDM